MKKDVLQTIVYPIVGALVIAAICFGISRAVHTTPPPPSPAIAPAGAVAQTGVPGNVVMRVNGQPVTDREFELFVSTLPEQLQQYSAIPAGRRQIAQQLARMIVLQQQAEKLGAEKDPDVKARLALGESNLVAQWAAEKLAGKPTEAQLRAEYQKQQNDLAAPELSHILVAYQGSEIPPRSGQAPPLDQAMNKAKQIEAQLRSGAPFAKMAAAVSDDTQSAAQGGQIGVVNPAQLPPELQQALAGLKPGDISKPVQSRFGIHILKVERRTAPPFDQVKPMLERQLQQTAITAAIDKLEKTASVQLDPKYFNAGPPPTTPVPQAPPRG